MNKAIKMCGICNEMMPITKFYSNGYRKDNKEKKYKPYCIQCENNRVNEQYILKIKEVLRQLGKTYSCEECGYNKNTAAIEFHHKHSGDKKHGVSNLKTANIGVIKKEIKKCLVLCANCHREKHNPDKMMGL